MTPYLNFNFYNGIHIIIIVLFTRATLKIQKQIEGSGKVTLNIFFCIF